MSTHPWMLVDYTPAELAAFIDYADAKRRALRERDG